MMVDTCNPCEALSPFIEQYIYHEGYVPGHTREIILPDGGIDLIIDMSDTAKHVFDNDSLRARSNYRYGWISGMRSERITIECGSGTPMLVIRFRPGGAWTFFGFPMTELEDHIEELDALWGPLYSELREQLLASASTRQMFRVLETYLLRLAADKLTVNPVIQYAVSAIANTMTPPTMKRLADLLGYSQKHVISMFDRMVGMSPKRYARVMRFQKIVNALELGRPGSWSDFAASWGFYDQAHFNNEFKAFAGMSPELYLNRKGPFLNYIAVTADKG